jgi:hypothetical protein
VHTHLEPGLEVRLLEAGIHPAGVGNLELGVEVGPLVNRVDEVMQPVAAVAVPAQSLHSHLMVTRCELQRNPGAVVVGQVHRNPVESGADQLVGDQVQVGTPWGSSREPQRRE